jgi:hypothetical protein
MQHMMRAHIKEGGQQNSDYSDLYFQLVDCVRSGLLPWLAGCMAALEAEHFLTMHEVMQVDPPEPTPPPETETVKREEQQQLKSEEQQQLKSEDQQQQIPTVPIQAECCKSV